jgi:hypothetical protein
VKLRRTGSVSIGTPASLSGPISPRKRSNESSNAPHDDIDTRSFRVVHPYHPLFQQEFELVTCRQNWGEDRVWFHDRNGLLRSIPTNWTDAGGIDPFVVVAAGRSLFRITDLLELALRIQALRPEQVGDPVK